MQRAPVALKTEKEVDEIQDFFNNWQPQLGSNAFEESSLIPQPQQPKQLALEDVGTKGSGIPHFTFPSSSASGSAGVPLPSGSLGKIDDALTWLVKAKDACNLAFYFIHFEKFPLYDLKAIQKDN